MVAARGLVFGDEMINKVRPNQKKNDDVINYEGALWWQVKNVGFCTFKELSSFFIESCGMIDYGMINITVKFQGFYIIESEVQ